MWPLHSLHMGHWPRCLGITLVILGNCLLEFSKSAAFGPGSADARLERLYGEYRTWCSMRGVHEVADKFTTKRLGVGKGSCIMISTKAAIARRMVDFVMEQVEIHDSGSRHDGLRRTSAWHLDIMNQKHAPCHGAAPGVRGRLAARMCIPVAEVWGLDRYYKRTQACGLFLDGPQARSIEKAMLVCLRSLSALSKEALRLKRRGSWRLKPKAHQCAHLVRDFCVKQRLNTRISQNYRNESFLGVIKHLMKSGHRRAIAVRALERFAVLCTTLRWTPQALG